MSPALASAPLKPSKVRSGVVSALPTVSWPASSAATTSVNVPPVSTAMR